MKGIMDRTSLIAFMKSTYKVDKDFNVDIQKVFPNITTDEIKHIKSLLGLNITNDIPKKIEKEIVSDSEEKKPKITKIKRNKSTVNK
jgi:hypothetical protein